MRTSTAGSLLLAGVFLLAGCEPPKHIAYASSAGDFTVQVPYGWSVYYDEQSSDYQSYTFVGPFEPSFFRGVPSLQVRWYASGKPRKLPFNGGSETYYGADDFVRRVKGEVYGPEAIYATATTKNPRDIHKVAISGWSGRHFIILSPTKVGADVRFGVSQDAKGERAIVRKHAYAVLPMDNGFYVITYPATLDGYGKYDNDFFRMVNSFKALKDGPAGPAL